MELKRKIRIFVDSKVVTRDNYECFLLAFYSIIYRGKNEKCNT